MQIAALSAGGYAATDPLAGTVHSVFARAVNIVVGSGRLISLVAREAGAVPCGFQLATPPHFSFLDRVSIGAAAVCRGGILRIDGSTLIIDLRPARPWRSLQLGAELDIERVAVARCWAVAWAALVAQRRESGLPAAADRPLAALHQATRALPGRAAARAARQLVGLGAGLTPAGDDLLVGYLAALWRSAALTPERHAFLVGLGARIVADAAGTNPISRSYLEAAAAGEIAETLAVLAERIARGAADADLRAAAHAALAVGESSGIAGSLGLLIGARAWAPMDRQCREPWLEAFRRGLLLIPLDDEADHAQQHVAEGDLR